MNQLTEWDLLHLHDHLSIPQAACCIVGIPTSHLGSNESTDPYLSTVMDENGNPDWNMEKLFFGAVSALVNAVKMKRLSAEIKYRGKYHHVRMVGDESEGYWEPVGDIDPWVTLIDVEDLKRWLESKQLRPVFFFGEQGLQAQYLDPSHPRFAPKLAAAVRAWEAMEDENLLQGKSEKKALEDWLDSRYKELRLVHQKDNERNGQRVGGKNNSAIAQAAAVANWNPEGGAPKTPDK